MPQYPPTAETTSSAGQTIRFAAIGASAPERPSGVSCLPCASTGIDALITGRALQLWRGPLLWLWAQVAEGAR